MSSDINDDTPFGRILKYQARRSENNPALHTALIPGNASVMCVAFQFGCPTVWASVPPGECEDTRQVTFVPTGGETSWGRYVGSLVTDAYVLHAFVETD